MGFICSCSYESDGIDQEISDLNVSETIADDSEMKVKGNARCSDKLTDKIYVSPRGQLLNNSRAVRGSQRADSSIGGKWSLAYLVRESLQLKPDPGNFPEALAREQFVVDQLINLVARADGNSHSDDFKGADSKIKLSSAKSKNGQKPVVDLTISKNDLQDRRSELLTDWGTKRGVDGKPYRWLGGAPFKLIAISNGIDVVQLRPDQASSQASSQAAGQASDQAAGKAAGKAAGQASNQASAGELRLIYSYESKDHRPLTIVFEYGMVVGEASGFGMSEEIWVKGWFNLRNYLADINFNKDGVQPNQSLMDQPIYRDSKSYLNHLEWLTEKVVPRQSMKLGTNATASSALLRFKSNSYLGDKWELREFQVSAKCVPSRLKLCFIPSEATNTPDESLRQSAMLGNWVEQNVDCAQGNDLTKCKINTPTASLPSTFGGPVVSLKKGKFAIAVNGKRWFGNPDQLPSIKMRYFSLKTCDGCHSNETGVNFTHVSPPDGKPSIFMTGGEDGVVHIPGSSLTIKPDLQMRLDRFRKLICLTALDQEGLKDKIFSQQIMHRDDSGRGVH